MTIMINIYYMPCILDLFLSKMSELKVEHWNSEKDGPLNETSMRIKLKSQGYSCITYTFPPGTDFPDHTHSVCKKDSIISGQFRFAMLGKEVILQPGDMLVVHNASVVGKESVVFFDATKSWWGLRKYQLQSALIDQQSFNLPATWVLHMSKTKRNRSILGCTVFDHQALLQLWPIKLYVVNLALGKPKSWKLTWACVRRCQPLKVKLNIVNQNDVSNHLL